MLRKKYIFSSFGFTLIELLVVVSIIGILASLALVSYSRSQKQARDTRRKSDLRQYQTALENYANNNNGLYPNVTFSNLCSTLGISNCPDDPLGGSNTYYYVYSTDQSDYSLRAILETYSNYSNWVVCSNGKSGETNTTPSQTNVCPL
jgi:prepilin-type N-terminal cleavage/methylation domain-containing protein